MTVATDASPGIIGPIPHESGVFSFGQPAKLWQNGSMAHRALLSIMCALLPVLAMATIWLYFLVVSMMRLAEGME